jgi:hypothetical protein
MGFVYLRAKARRYVKVGSDTYRRQDFFGLPEAGMDEEDPAALIQGMKQLATVVGAKPDRPFIGISIRGFNDMRHVAASPLAVLWEEIARSGATRPLWQPPCSP